MLLATTSAKQKYTKGWAHYTHYEQLVESIAELEADISDVNNLLLDYAMSIYPHGDAPEWPTISQGVKDLVDYAKALDKPAKSGAACSVKADELIVDLMYKSWEVGAYGGSAPDEIEQEMELARDEAKAKLVEYIGGLESKVGKWIDNSKYPLNELNGVGKLSVFKDGKHVGNVWQNVEVPYFEPLRGTRLTADDMDELKLALKGDVWR